MPVGHCYRCDTVIEPLPVAAVVREDEAAGRAGHRGGARAAALQLHPRALDEASTCTGWRTSATGASAASSGGATASRCGTATTAATRSVARTDPTRVPAVRQRRAHARTPTCSTPGSSSWLWPFSTWAGRRTRRRCAASTRPTRWSPPPTSSSSGSRAWSWPATSSWASARSATSTCTASCATSRAARCRKSLGNSPDPLDVIDKYGADALRFTLVSLAPAGQDVRFDGREDRARAATSPTRSGTRRASC